MTKNDRRTLLRAIDALVAKSAQSSRSRSSRFGCRMPQSMKMALPLMAFFCWLWHDPMITAFAPTPDKQLGAGFVSRRGTIGSFRISSKLFQRKETRRRRGPQPKQILLNKEIMALGRSRKWKEILQLYDKEKNDYNNINYSTTLIQLGRIRYLNKSDALFGSFVKDLSYKLGERGIEWIGIQGAANIVYAIAKMQLKSPDTKRIIDDVAGINAKGIVTKGKPQEVANIAWALAKLDCFDIAPTFFVEVEKRAEWLVQEGEPQHVANTAWACGTFGIHSQKLFAAIERHADWLVQEGVPQAIANTAWACGTLGVPLPNLFASIEKHAEWLVREGKPQEVANTAWACGALGIHSPKLFAAIEERAGWLVLEGIPQTAANTAWACGTLGIQSPQLFATIEEHAGWIVREGTTQEVANTLWAFGKHQYDALKILEVADARGPWLVETGTPQDIANSAFAFAQLGYEPKTFLEALDNKIEKLAQGGNAQEICNTCYALSILDRCQSAMLSRLWNKAMCLKPSGCRSEELQQLAQVYALCEAAGTNLSDPSHELLALMCKTSQESVTVSRSQIEVSKCLRDIGIQHEWEISPFPESSPFVGTNMLAIDLAAKHHSLAIEFDGDSHFLRELGTGDVTKIENGATKAKRTFLKRMGWKVVNIHYFDWIEATDRGKDAAVSFLREELRRQLTPQMTKSK